jgi:hypothetical protein
MDCKAWQGDGSVESLLPHKVTQVLNQFDRTRTMQPFTFEVQLQP